MSKSRQTGSRPSKKSGAYGTRLPGAVTPESGVDNSNAATFIPGQLSEKGKEAKANTDSKPAFGTQVAPPAGANPPPPLPTGSAPSRRPPPSQQSIRSVTATQQPAPHGIDGVLVKLTRKYAKTVSIPDLDNMPEPEGFADVAVDGTPKPEKRSRRRAPGKSTWNLRIKQRGVAGHISGIINEIPNDPSQATGLQSALTIDESAAEYEIISELGAGNMGIVYRARQTSLNRELAIKTLKPDSPNVEHDQAMFVSEAVVTANLVHPNIVPIHDLGRTSDGKLFYSMKQVSGTPWQDTIRENSTEENLEIFLKVCDAVAYAHSRGVINRDLKPENVIVGSYGEVIVLDWGLAITTSEFSKKDSVIVDFRGGGGTPVYMAPELLDDDVTRVGTHSDIYLLGAILFELLEGFQPHLLRETWDMTDPEEQLNSVIWAVMNNQIEPLVANEGELMEIARKAMATHPDDRFAKVEDLQEAIREYRITGRAEELMLKVEQKGTTTYSEYQSAVALYEEALRKWPSNRRAQDGNRKARLAYAELAQKKGDIDLGLQVIPSEGDRQFQSVRKKLKRTKRTRTIIRATWSLLLVAAVGLSAFLLLTQAELRNGRQVLAQQEKEIESKTAIAAAKTREAEEATAIAESKTAEVRESEAKIAAAKEELKTAQAELKEAADTNMSLAVDIKIKEAELEEKQKEAEEATKAAEAAKKLLQTATQQATDANAKAAEATAAAELAEKQKIIATFDGLVDRVQAKIDIRDYKMVDDLAEKAEKIGNRYDFIGEERVKAIEKQRRAANAKKNQNAAIQRPGEVELALISRDGSTLIADARVEKRSRNVRLAAFRNEDIDNVAAKGHPLSFEGRQLKDIAVSATGDLVGVVDDDLIQLWQWSGKDYQDVKLSTPLNTRKLGLKLRHILVSEDESHVFLISEDRFATVLAFSIRGGIASLVASSRLDTDDGSFKNVVDAVILPDKSSLILALGDGNCRSVHLAWNGNVPQFPVRKPGDALDKVLPRLQGLLDLGTRGGDGVNGRFEPKRLAVSHDNSQLGLIEGGRFFVVPRDENARPTDFPFKSPRDLKGFAVTECGMDQPIRGIEFSHDGSRVITAQDRYMQVWHKTNNSYKLADISGLLGDKFLAAHGSSVEAFKFVGQSTSHVLSIGNDNVIRRWNLDEYHAYAAEFQRIYDELEALTKKSTSKQSAFRAIRLRDRSIRVAESVADSIPQTAERSRKQWGQQSRYILTAGPQPPVQTPPNAMRFRQARRIFSARFSKDNDRIVVGADDLAAHSFKSINAERTASVSMLFPRDPFFAPERNNFLEGHVPEIVSMTFLPPDGKQLLTLDYFGSISVWDAFDDENGIGYELSRPLPSEPVTAEATGKPYEVEDSYCEVAVSPDGKYVVAGGVRNDGESNVRASKDEYFAAIWKVAEFSETATPGPYRELRDVHNFRITAAAFSPDGSRVITAGRRGLFALWDFENNKVLARAKNGHNADGVSGVFFADDNTIISAGFDGKVFRWTIDGENLVPSEMGRDTSKSAVPDYIIRMRPAPDRSGFITSDLTKDPKEQSYQLKLNFWSSQNGWQSTLPVDIKAPQDDLGRPYRHDISWSDDSQQILFVHDERLLVLKADGWKVTTGLRLPKGYRAIRGAFAPSADGHQQLATFDGRFAHLWNLESGEHVTAFRSHGSSVRATFSFDRRYVATASDSIRIFNSDEASPDHGRPVFRLSKEATGNVLPADIAFSPIDGDYRFASIDAVGTVKLWGWTPGAPPPKKPLLEVEPEGDDANVKPTLANTISWSDDGRLLATTRSGQVQLWKVQDDMIVPIELKIPESLFPEDLAINDLDFSADGTLLVAGGAYDEEAYGLVWKIENDMATPVASIEAEDRHTGAKGVTAVVINDATSEVITGGADSRIQRWQLGGTQNDDLTELPWIIESEGRGPGSTDGFRNPHEKAITSLDTASDGRFVSTDDDGWIVIWPSKQ